MSIHSRIPQLPELLSDRCVYISAAGIFDAGR